VADLGDEAIGGDVDLAALVFGQAPVGDFADEFLEGLAVLGRDGRAEAEDAVGVVEHRHAAGAFAADPGVDGVAF
jgi:hypothetical protein